MRLRRDVHERYKGALTGSGLVAREGRIKHAVLPVLRHLALGNFSSCEACIAASHTMAHLVVVGCRRLSASRRQDQYQRNMTALGESSNRDLYDSGATDTIKAYVATKAVVVLPSNTSGAEGGKSAILALLLCDDFARSEGGL